MDNSDNDLAAPNIAGVDADRKGERTTASMRIPWDDLHLLDAAAYRLRVKRSTLIYDATMARVREVLAA